MSNFFCEKCGKQITEGPGGHYTTGCEHYPLRLGEMKPEYFKAEVKERLEYIKASQSDYESAHGSEDNLREFFIEWIMTMDKSYFIMYPNEIKEIAKMVLSTNDLDFPRYCA